MHSAPLRNRNRVTRPACPSYLFLHYLQAHFLDQTTAASVSHPLNHSSHQLKSLYPIEAIRMDKLKDLAGKAGGSGQKATEGSGGQQDYVDKGKALVTLFDAACSQWLSLVCPTLLHPSSKRDTSTRPGLLTVSSMEIASALLWPPSLTPPFSSPTSIRKGSHLTSLSPPALSFASQPVVLPLTSFQCRHYILFSSFISIKIDRTDEFDASRQDLARRRRNSVPAT